MNENRTFRTKTGFCHILPDKIILSRDGIVGNVAEMTVGNNITRPLFIYGIIATALFYLGFNHYSAGDFWGALFSVLLGAYLVYGVMSSLNNSATPVIYRQSIKTVKFKKGMPGLTPSRFEVFFKTGRR